MSCSGNQKVLEVATNVGSCVGERKIPTMLSPEAGCPAEVQFHLPEQDQHEDPSEDARLQVRSEVTSDQHPGGLSVVAEFDQLVRNCGVLTTGEEEQNFLDFVLSPATSWQRKEGPVEQSESLASQLTSSTQQIALLQWRLERAQGMQQAEVEGRLKAQQDRDFLASKLSKVRRLVEGGGSKEQVRRVMGLDTQEGSLKVLEGGEEGCEGNNIFGVLDRRVEERMGPEVTEDGKIQDGEVRQLLPSQCPVPAGGHSLLEKTVVNTCSCGGCGRRLRFGQLGMKCSLCRLVLHLTCTSLVATNCHGGSGSRGTGQRRGRQGGE